MSERGRGRRGAAARSLSSAILACALASCGHAPTRGPPASDGVSDAGLGPLSPPVSALPWDAGHPERATWSAFAFTLVRARYLPELDRAADAGRFCAGYADLDADRRATVWAAVISSVAFFESGWNPSARAAQAGGNLDAVTGRPVVAEGLLQLGYADALRGPYCRFDWPADEARAADDPDKTIFAPRRHLECGIGILARQVARRGQVVSPTGIYWSVLREGGAHDKSDAIAAMTRRLPFCGG